MHDDRGRAATRRPPRPIAFVPFAAKLSPPVASIPLVDRPRLVDDLVAFTGRVVVLSAPAGYGKSSLAAQWIAADPRPSGWLSLDVADNDPHVLLTYLALAAGESGGTGLTAEAELDELKIALRDLLAHRARPGILVLDDAHVLTGDAAALVATIAEYVPAGSVLAILTREPPSIPTARGVLHGTVRVLDADALAMTVDEAEALLDRSGIPSVDSTTAEALTDATEGWPAGLYLASLALRDTADPLASARTISGRQRRITDFFTEEVLPTIAPADLDFLLESSILDRCSAELCDAVLDRTDSAAVLERLARTNRFVIPLDDTGQWYRYHHLFGEMLLAEARRRNATGVTRTALRASEWWEARLEPDAAVTLALAAPDRARTLDLVTRWGPILQTDRRRPTVDRWLSAFTEAEVLATPTLANTAAWSALLVGDAAGVHRYAAVLETAGDEMLPDRTPARAAADLLQALTTSSGVTAMRDHAASARAGFAAGAVYRSVASLVEANARSLLGDIEGTVDAVDEAIAIGRTSAKASWAQALAVRARIEAMAGGWDAAGVAVEEGIRIAEDCWFDERPPIGLSYATAALVRAHTGHGSAARRARAVALPLIHRLDDVMPFLSALALLELAESALLTDDVDDATTLLTEAERRLRRLRDSGLLPFALARVAALLTARSARGSADLVEPLSPAELRVLVWLPTHLSFGEIGEELFVSRNTVKSHAMAIYRKLGVTSRSAAVKEAVGLGLIEG